MPSPIPDPHPGEGHLIVDNRDPGEVPHWPAFEKWWLSRCRLVGPHHESTDVLWITANLTNGLRGVPYCWAGVFVLEVARFMYPQQHFGLVDNDCVPVTLFEVPDLVALATSQMQWTDLVGLAPDDPKHNDKVGLLLVTEAHLEYNAGLVISIGSRGRPSPIASQSSADVLSEELADYRLQLLAMARPPINPTDCSQGATMFTPLVGVPMENSLDLVIVWAMCGSFMCKKHSGHCPIHALLLRLVQEKGCRLVGPRRPCRSLIRGGTRAHTVAHQVGTCHFRARVSLRVAAPGRNMQSTVPAW